METFVISKLAEKCPFIAMNRSAGRRINTVATKYDRVRGIMTAAFELKPLMEEGNSPI